MSTSTLQGPPATDATNVDSIAAAPLRDAVLAGRFFGTRHVEQARAVAEFAVDEPAQAVRRWFGASAAQRLLALDQDALRGVLDRDIAAIDSLLSEQVDAILQNARMRRLEGSWRGLAWLVGGLEPGAQVKVRLLTVSWAEVCRDLERAAEFDQSNLFRLIYEGEFGMPGGEPFGVLLVDHEVRHRPTSRAPTDDVAAIAGLAAIAAASFAVVVLAASPALLDVDEFADLAMASDPASPLRQPLHDRWRSLAGRDDMRFVCVVMPRVLARPPWADDPARADGFRYVEYAPQATNRVWMSAGYPFAAVVARAFTNHAWPADIRGVDIDREGGGVVTQLPVEGFTTDPPGVWARPPLDLVLHDGQERMLVEAGLMPLSALPYGVDAAFTATGSLQQPRSYAGAAGEAATANARISSQINAMLCASRFAHYIKVIVRDMVGTLETPAKIEQRLQTWLNGYINAAINAGPETRARQPLVAGRVTVSERMGRAGAYGCTIQLQPHFQLDDIRATFRLVTEVSAPGQGR
jgi:type VI secretion system ImpC/EvpB family protein